MAGERLRRDVQGPWLCVYVHGHMCMAMCTGERLRRDVQAVAGRDRRRAGLLREHPRLRRRLGLGGRGRRAGCRRRLLPWQWRPRLDERSGAGRAQRAGAPADALGRLATRDARLDPCPPARVRSRSRRHLGRLRRPRPRRPRGRRPARPRLRVDDWRARAHRGGKWRRPDCLGARGRLPDRRSSARLAPLRVHGCMDMHPSIRTCTHPYAHAPTHMHRSSARLAPLRVHAQTYYDVHVVLP